MMSKKNLYIFLLAGLILAAAGPISQMATINLHIQKRGDDTVWRVWDNEGNNRGLLRVNRQDEDKINWRAHDSDMEFRFHRDVSAYFDYPDSLFADGKTQRIASGDWLRLTLKDSAPQDTLVYDVWVAEADTFVVGNSPPVLIVF